MVARASKGGGGSKREGKGLVADNGSRGGGGAEPARGTNSVCNACVEGALNAKRHSC